MADYIEKIKVGNGDAWPVKDTEAHRLIAAIWNTIYPVGSIYMSVNSTDPGTLFGGTWESIQDSFLLAAGSTYGAGATGGSATVTLTEDQMPSHTHMMTVDTDASPRYTWYNNISAGVGEGGRKGYVLLSSTDTDYVEGKGYPITTSRGGDQPHNNMPPYLAVYMWQRTA